MFKFPPFKCGKKTKTLFPPSNSCFFSSWIMKHHAVVNILHNFPLMRICHGIDLFLTSPINGKKWRSSLLSKSIFLETKMKCCDAFMHCHHKILDLSPLGVWRHSWTTSYVTLNLVLNDEKIQSLHTTETGVFFSPILYVWMKDKLKF